MSFLSDLLKKLLNVPPDVQFGYVVGPPKFKSPYPRKKKNVLELTLNSTQQIVVRLNPRTHGTATHPDGIPTQVDPNTPIVWEKLSGNATIEVAPDGMSATLISSDGTDESVFQVSADADLGAGVTTLVDTIKLKTIQAEAENLGLAADAPTDKP